MHKKLQPTATTMSIFYSMPQILGDQTRLPEIYRLRCLAWQNSPSAHLINFKKYPDGFQDTIDLQSLHFCSVNQQDEIIGAARLTLAHRFEELPYSKIFSVTDHWPAERPFLYYSRLVIHPGYRKTGLKEKLDRVRISYQQQHRIAFSVTTVLERRAAELETYGFKKIATVSPDSDKTYPFERDALLCLLLENIRM